MIRSSASTCMVLLLTMACGAGDGDGDANDTPEAPQSAQPPSGSEGESQLTECDENVPADGACDPTMACAAYDPDCTDEDLANIPVPPVSDEAADQAAGGGPAGGTQLTECDENVPSDGTCDPTMACAAYDPDCTDEDLANIPVPPVSDEAADQAAGSGPAPED